MPNQPISFLLPKKENFQQVLLGKSVDLFYIQNDNLQIAITNYGARIVSMNVKDLNGNWTDVIVGFDSLTSYLKTDEFYHGAIVGRYANRIANGQFSLNGKAYHLATNNGKNHLHGGIKGFHDVVWNLESSTENTIILTYESIDGEEGYPGTLKIEVFYTLGKDYLQIEFKAICDQDTIINVTNHSYFNLNGQGSGSIENHQLQLFASNYTPINEVLIPTGQIASVMNSPLDFTLSKKIGQQINDSDPQLQFGFGYDHNFVLDKKDAELDLAAISIGDQSKIIMRVYTTEPGIQLYTGNFMKGTNIIKNQLKDEFRSAFCLETQHFPDSPNQPHFPSTVLKTGENFSSITRFEFNL